MASASASASRGPVERLDHVGDPHGVARLVGLQAADEVQAERRVGGAQRGELGGGLLDAVLAEHRLAGGQRGGDGVGGMGFRHRDQGDILGAAAGARARRRRCASRTRARLAAISAGESSVMDERLVAWARAVKSRQRRKGAAGRRGAVAVHRRRAGWPTRWRRRRRLPRGLCGVVLRDDAAPGRAALGRALARLCRARGLALSVAGDWRLAAALGAGLHLRGGRRPAGAPRWLRGADQLGAWRGGAAAGAAGRARWRSCRRPSRRRAIPARRGWGLPLGAAGARGGGRAGWRRWAGSTGGRCGGCRAASAAGAIGALWAERRLWSFATQCFGNAMAGPFQPLRGARAARQYSRQVRLPLPLGIPSVSRWVRWETGGACQYRRRAGDMRRIKMRKLLLASAAMLGGTMALASVASAQLADHILRLASPTRSQQPAPVPCRPTPIPPPGIGTAVPSFGTAAGAGQHHRPSASGRMYCLCGRRVRQRPLRPARDTALGRHRRRNQHEARPLRRVRIRPPVSELRRGCGERDEIRRVPGNPAGHRRSRWRRR